MQKRLKELAWVAAATAGLAVDAMDEHIFAAALKRRLRATGAADFDGYVARHRADAAEREAFLEEVLIGETSFFRDAAVFAEMTRWCVRWRESHAGVLRILSAPCSTGEEPYSIAATLLAAGFGADQFRIDAIDISALAVEHARAGVYHGFALRNVAEPAQTDFLEPHGASWRVKAGVRERVYFRRANLLDEGVLTGHAYDLIFARNLMIYQTPKARVQTARVLAQSLAADGRLVIGSADWGSDLAELFALEQPVHSFALRHRAARGSVMSPQPSVRKAALMAPKGRPAIAASPSRRAENDVQQQAPRVMDADALTLSAQEAYTRGESGTAEWICRQALYVDPACVRALDLLSRIERPRVSRRMHLALHARLHRMRLAEGKAS